MVRMHTSGKGISRSSLPYGRSAPTWSKSSADDVAEKIGLLAKKGLRPSQIGAILRDAQGVPQVRRITGSKILRLLKAKGMGPEIPEDLYNLIKKAARLRKHLERCRKDIHSKYRLILVESVIHRLSRYYKICRAIPSSWNYDSAAASLVA